MEKKAFQLLDSAEGSWWYRGRSLAVDRILRAFGAHPVETILDLGAGNGGMCRALKGYGKTIYAMEPDAGARDAASRRGYEKVFASMEEVKSSGISFDLVAALDVVEHVNDDKAFIDDLASVLSPTGALVLTVPANQWLWSKHDVSHHHYRRYGANRIKILLAQAGFNISYLGHWNALLLFAAILARLFGRSGESSLVPGSPLDRILFRIVLLETSLIPLVSFPFGLSIITYARRGK